MEVFVFITRTKTPYIESRVRSMVSMGVDAYAMVDELEKPTKRLLTFPDEQMKQLGWTHHMSYATHQITAWDKASYFGYLSKADYVWFCEDDMYWNKPSVIRSIMEEASKKKDDLIAFPLAPSYEEKPTWFHWNKAELLTKNKSKWIATYNQLSRVSKRVLEEMYKLSQSRKRLFFHEIMFGTICRMKGYPVSYIQDLRLPIHIVNRWRPSISEDEAKKEISEHKYVLLHPVKFLIEAPQ
jgi:glycosyltransferase involved in cell wall biosynthesis